MKIIINREDLIIMLTLMRKHDRNAATEETDRVTEMLEIILKEHPWRSDGVTGAEMDEWPEYATEDYENINRKMIVHILYMLSAIHYEIDYKEMRAMAQKLLLQLAGQPHEDIN